MARIIKKPGCLSESGLRLLFPDVTSFVVKLNQRRDASFYLCGEVCRFIHKLCFRFYTPDTTPLENAWFVLLAFKTSEGKYMGVDEFLVRQKLTQKVNTASKQKAERIHSGSDSPPSAIQKTTETVKQVLQLMHINTSATSLMLSFVSLGRTPTSLRDLPPLIPLFFISGQLKLLFAILRLCTLLSSCVLG